MTAKEKAKEIVNNFYCKKDALGLLFCINYSNAKQCALIAVDEVLETLYSLKFGNAISDELEYFENVKQEIEKL